MRALDVAVAGCGVAGLAAALLLDRDGHRVTLFERFAKPQPVGSGLMIQPTGQAVLRALGLDSALLEQGARIERLTGEANGRTVLDVHYAALEAGRFGIGIHRAALFAILHDAVRARGIAIRTGCPVERTSFDGAHRHVHCGANGSEAFDLVVDALGARSPLVPAGRLLAYGALWASVPWQPGFDAAALQQRYRHASVMVGVMPSGTLPGETVPQAAFFWSLRGDRLADWQARGLAAWKAEVLDLWPATAPLLDAIAAPEQLTFARYAHRTLASPVALGLIHIGDASHCTSPQLGQGANMALLDAYALMLGLRAENSVAAALAHAVRLRQGHIRLYQAMSRLFTPIYQSDGRAIPFARDRIVGPLSRLRPIHRLQAAMVSGSVGAPLGRLRLA